MKVLLKWAAVLLMVITQSLHAENNFFNEGGHQGFKPGLQGTYDNKPQQLIVDMFAGKDIFQVPGFAQAFLDNARYACQDASITLADLKAGITVGGAPTGFIKDPMNSSYEISRWKHDYSEIQWTARFPNKNEKFLWFRGVCIMSVFCGNLTRPRFIPDDIAIIEEEPAEPYIATEKVKATYASNPGTNIYITNTNTNTNNNSSPIGASNLEFGDGGGSSRRQSYNDGPQEMIVRTPARAVDWVNAGGSLLQGVGMMKQAFWPATQNVRISGQQQSRGWNQGSGGWGRNNYHHNNGGNGYTNNGAWSGGTDLQSQGPLPANLYNNGTGIIRGSHPYSNNAYTGRSSGSTQSSGSIYGMYNRGY